MFEKAKSISHAHSAPIGGAHALDGDLLVGSEDSAPEGYSIGGSALRMIEWSELKARLNAARDLREVLRRDATGNIEANGSTFADAAARYFRTKDEHQDEVTKREERDVNPVALGGSKGSPGITQGLEDLQDEDVSNQGHAAIGDARED